MDLPEDFEDWVTYFGVYSATQMARVSELLNGLGVRYDVWAVEETEERLKAWSAWDADAPDPHQAHALFVYSGDVGKVGTHLIEMYPEKLGGA